MALKFCFKHEIHRCSELPGTLEALTPFLTNKFQVTLPSSFTLYYDNSENQRIFVASEEDYQLLKQRTSSKPIKVYIADKEGDDEPRSQASIIEDLSSVGSDFGVIQQQSVENVESSEVIQREEEQEEEVKRVDEVQPQGNDESVVEQLSEDLTKNYILPRLEESRIDISVHDDVKKVVKDSLLEQMPYIVAHIRQSLIQEQLAAKQQNISQFSEDNFNNEPKQQEDAEPMIQAKKDEEDNVFAKIISKISEFPSKAIEAIDNFAQKIEGDPYVYIDGKKYFTSTTERAAKIQEIFPEEDKMKILNFVQALPKQLPINKTAELYMVKMEMEQQENQ